MKNDMIHFYDKYLGFRFVDHVGLYRFVGYVHDKGSDFDGSIFTRVVSYFKLYGRVSFEHGA